MLRMILATLNILYIVQIVLALSTVLLHKKFLKQVISVIVGK